VAGGGDGLAIASLLASSLVIATGCVDFWLLPQAASTSAHNIPVRFICILLV
jgi:hypothetical protein